MRNILILLFLAGSNGYSQDTLTSQSGTPIPASDTNIPAIETDRPTATYSPATVPEGRFQFEMGSLFSNNTTDVTVISTFILNNTLFRYGLAENIELRITSDYVSIRETHLSTGLQGTTDGFAPVQIGFKYRISSNRKMFGKAAILAHIGLNRVASSVFETPNPSHNVIYVASHDIGKTSSLGYNIGMIWDGYSPSISGLYSLVYSRSLNTWLSGFLEIYGSWPQSVGINAAMDGGFTMGITKSLQFDISGGYGLSEEVDDWFASAGVSFIL